jgi:hypothetical protein
MLWARTIAAALLLCVAAVNSVAAQDSDDVRRWRRGDGVSVRIAKSYYLPAGQVASWPIVVIGGGATIEGRLEDDLVVIGGAVRIGPSAQVDGNVVAIGGGLDISDSATVRGEVHDVNVIWPEIRFAFRDWLWGINNEYWAVFTLAATVLRFTLLMLASCFLALVAPRWLRRIQGRVSDSAVAATLVGLAAEVMFVPMLVVVIAALVLTLVGIPLLVLVPFVVLFFILMWIAGFASVAAQLGGAVRSRIGLGNDSLVIDAAWGVMILFLLTFIGNLLAFGPWFLRPASLALSTVGFLVEYFAWTIGLGAALLAPFAPRWGSAPPPIPSTAAARA